MHKYLLVVHNIRKHAQTQQNRINESSLTYTRFKKGKSLA